MSGASRHAQSGPRRGQGRSQGPADAGTGAGRSRGPGPLPEPADLARVLEPAVRAAGMDLGSVPVSPAGWGRLPKLGGDAAGGVGLGRVPAVTPARARLLGSRSGIGASA